MLNSKKKYILIILCSVFVFILCSCKNQTNDTDSTNTITNAPTQAIAPTLQPEKDSPTITPSNSISEEQNTEEFSDNLAAFNELEDSFLDPKFIVTEIGTDDITGYLIEGNYDLNSDNTIDNIKIDLKYDGVETSSIEVNTCKLEFYMVDPIGGKVRIIDLDKNDNFIEIACFDAGPSGDPIYVFFRYDGEKLYELGSIDAGALVNGEGIVISGFHISKQFKPLFCSAWFEIEDNKLVIRNNDTKKYLGQTYDFIGGEGYFTPYEEIPQNPQITWENSKNFEAGKVKIIDILNLDDNNRILNFYYVEFSSGETGLLYFWIGD